MPVFNVLAALLALLMLARHGRRALGLFTGVRDEAGAEVPGGRAAALIPLLNCVIAGAVLWVAVKGLLSGLMNPPGGPP